ncbi:MAG: glycosyltransferase [Propionivibrio sp.]|nr:glycosyltransferase [Propionivibrio sp.]
MTDNRAPLVSIVVPCWNLETYLDETLRSVAAQTWQRFEVLMVDDCSTDRTWEVIQKWQNRITGFIQFSCQPTGAWLQPAMRLWLVPLANSLPCWTGATLSDLAFGDNPLCVVGATLVRRAAMESIGGFDPNFRTQEDTLLWLRLANLGSFVYSPRITAHYRQRPGSIIHSLKEPNEFHYLKVLNWVSSRPEFRKHRRTIDAIMADCHYISAVHFRSCRDYGRAKFHAKNALKLHPTSFSYWREFIASWVERNRNA